MAARGIIASILAAAFLLPASARAENPAALVVRWSVHDDHIAADFDLSSAFDKETASALKSGLTSRVRITLELHALGTDGEVNEEPLSVFVRECEVVYDLWGERFGLRLTDGGRSSQTLVDGYDEVVARCGRFHTVALAPVGALDLRRRYVLEVRFALNPTTQVDGNDETDYVGDPIGHRRGGEQGATLFGAMARLFVRDPPEEGDPVHRYRSPTFGEETIRQALRKSGPPVQSVSQEVEEE